ncbi:hypothetical protein G7054_g1182 [Neopestalotiopsis clavispora]|nr:hypothetical protein G7054_g1182 [Neopestalotiopsis clavispora]
MWQELRNGVTRIQEEYACALNGIGPLRLTKREIFSLFLRKIWLDIQNSCSDVGAIFVRLQQEYACALNGIGPLRLTKTQILGLFIRKTWLDIQNSWIDASVTARVLFSIFLSLVVVFVADSVRARHTSLTRRGFPLLERPKGQRRWDFQAKMQEGCRQFPKSPYIIKYGGFEQIVYPSSSYNEVKTVPVSDASLMEYFAHCFFEGWHFLGREIGALHGALGVDLARSLPSRVADREDIARRAFDQVVGPCREWKSIRLYGSVQKLVAMTNAPALLGPELGTDKRWLNTFDMFIYSLMFALLTLNPVPHKLRPVFKYISFGPNWLLYQRLKRLARPTVETHLREYDLANKAESTSRRSDKSKHHLGGWLAARYKADELEPDRLAHDFIVTMFESMPTTTCTLYFILSELVLRPELADDLRAEVTASLNDGQLPSSQLGELRKMDSFIREATRTNIFSYRKFYAPLDHAHPPLNLLPLTRRIVAVAVFRRALKPIKLSIGPEVPAGAVICIDAYNMVKSPEKWGNPDTFDPERFLKMRHQPGHENLHQFTSLDSDMPGWGGGPQACPGRVFAGNSIKIFLAHLLLNYDIKLPPGASKPAVGSMANGSVMPDLFAKIMIRERRKS